MKNQPQSREELEAKLKKYDKRLKFSLRTTVVGSVFILSSLIYAGTTFHSRIAPPIFKDYTNACITLNRLENRLENRGKDLFEMSSLPYKTKEITPVKDIIQKGWEEQTPVINKAIASVKEDIYKMEENPGLKQYFTNKKNIAKNFFAGAFGGFSLFVLGLGNNTVLGIKRIKYEERLKRVSKRNQNP